MFEIKLPELGEGIEKATVAYWHYKVGDVVRKDEDVVEVVTDKATFNVHAETNGTIKEICVQVGEEADVGTALVILDSNS